MKTLRLLCLFVAFPQCGFALFGVGDKPTNYCWKDSQDAQICLEDPDLQNRVRVLLYNAGWCGPCNDEFGDIKDATDEFEGKLVTFISLSSEGWNYGSRADKKFLNDWRTTHKLDQAKASFVVAGSARDAGKDFFKDTYIPNVVVIDLNGEVAYKAINPGVSAIAAEVRKLIPRPIPHPIPVTP